MRIRTSQVVGIILAVVVLAIVFGLRPWFHGLAMMFYLWTVPTIVLVGGIVACIVAVIKNDYGTYHKGFGWAVSATVVCAIVFLMYIFCGGSWVANSLYQHTEYNEISEMPANNPDALRIMPYQVAHKYATDSFVEPTEKLGDVDTQLSEGDKLVYRMPKVPDGTILYFKNKPSGYQDIAASGTDLAISSGGEKMEIGEDIAITDNWAWVLHKQQYFVDLTDPYYVENLMVVPYIGYKGFWFKTPYFAGVFTIDSDGNVKDYTPDEAAELPGIKGNRLFPEDLARRQVEAYAFKRGILNVWFYHEEQIEVADISGDNRFPYFIPTEDGPRWVTPCEPIGDSYGIIKMFYTDAVTGEIEFYSVPKEKLLTGPVRAVSQVKKELPQFAWDIFDGVEPRPVVVDSQLYWMISIVNTKGDAQDQYSGVARTVFVDAKTNKVYSFEEDADVLKFMAGPEKATPISAGTASTPAPSDTTSATADVPLSTNDRQAIINEISKIESELAALRSRLATPTK